MDFSHADGVLGSDTTEASYGNTVETPDDLWWESLFNTAHFNAIEDEAHSAPTTTTFDYTPPMSNGIDQSQSPHPLSTPPSARARTSYQTIQSPTDSLTTFNSPLAPHLSWLSDPFSSPTFDTPLPSGALRAIGIVPAGHDSAPDNTTLPDGFHDIRSGLEQQPQAQLLAAEAKSYDAQHGDFPFGLEEQPSQSSPIPVNRAEYTTSDNLAKPYFRAVEGHRHTQEWNGTCWGSTEKTSVEQPSTPSPVWRHKYQLKVPPADDPTSSHGLGQQGSPPGPSSTLSTTSTTISLPIDDDWSCATCGTIFTTKDAKNRKRNKKRHRCPGTGPKYPCPICPKSFNRGDSRLVHLRRWHPEMHTEPPQARKEKDLTEGSMN